MATEDEDEAGEAEAGAAAGGKKKKKLIIIIAVAVLLLGGGGGAAFYFMKKKGGGAEGEKEAAAETKGGHGAPAGAKPGPAGAPTFFELPQFLVNLNTDNKSVSFIKLNVVLELANGTDVEQVTAMQPRVVNDINTYLRELRTSDLAGSTGLERLREELLMRVNKSIAPAQANNILFKEIIVQ